MNAVRIRPASLGDGLFAIRHMRPQDVAELAAAGGETPREAVERTFAQCTYARAAWYGFELLSIYGVTPLAVLGGYDQLWIFCTDAIDRHPFAFARASWRVAAELKRNSRLLTNFVDAGDVRVLRWAKWLGARFSPPVERGGRLFHQFVIEGVACRPVSQVPQHS